MSLGHNLTTKVRSGVRKMSGLFGGKLVYFLDCERLAARSARARLCESMHEVTLQREKLQNRVLGWCGVNAK